MNKYINNIIFVIICMPFIICCKTALSQNASADRKLGYYIEAGVGHAYFKNMNFNIKNKLKITEYIAFMGNYIISDNAALVGNFVLTKRGGHGEFEAWDFTVKKDYNLNVDLLELSFIPMIQFQTNKLGENVKYLFGQIGVGYERSIFSYVVLEEDNNLIFEGANAAQHSGVFYITKIGVLTNILSNYSAIMGINWQQAFNPSFSRVRYTYTRTLSVIFDTQQLNRSINIFIGIKLY